MSFSVIMPRLGESVTEGTVLRWLKKEGEHVDADEPLLEVSTDKVDTEVPAPTSGTLVAIKVREDETVEIGVEIALIGEGGDILPTAQFQPPTKPTPTAKADAQASPIAARTAVPQAESRRRPPAGSEAINTYVTPLVRKLASKHAIDLTTMQGSGTGGRIRKADVLAAIDQREAPAPLIAPLPSHPVAPAPATAPTPTPTPTPTPHTVAQSSAQQAGRVEKLSPRRKLIAARMVESLQVSAQLTTVVEVDVTRIARLRQENKADFETRESVKLSFLPFFVVATVEALKKYPLLNSSIDTEAGTITYHGAQHLGLAVDTEGGLTVPVIANAGDLNLGGIARRTADLATRTRHNNISPDELVGGTFTLTNTGSRGALFDTPIINQPQVGVLGTGTVVERPVVIDDPNLGKTITVRSMVYLALSYDHRIVDGADAARFLGAVKERLETADFGADLANSVQSYARTPSTVARR